MRYLKEAVSAAALVLWVGTVSAQERPNLAGKWALDAEKTTAANPNAGGGGRMGGRGGMGAGPLTLAVDGSTLAITRELQDGPVTTTYKLDDSEQEVSMGQMTGKAKAKWDGAKIVIVTVTQGQNGERRSTAEYTMEGDWLVVSTTAPARGGGDPVTRKMYYKKG